MLATLVKTLITAVLGLALAGCGGGGDDGSAPPPANSDIGAAGGTVTGPSGAQVVVPAGALAASTAIGIAQSSAGAPALPAGVTAFGPIFAFTPHGTSFAAPATITVPFDPASVPAGTTPALYKTNATQTAWEVVPGATVSGTTMSGQVSGFSYAAVAAPPSTVAEPTEKTWLLAESSRHDFLILADTQGPPELPQVGGVVDLHFNVGLPLPVYPVELSPNASNLAVFSNESGKTFWTLAIAPHTDPAAPDHADQAFSKLRQIFMFEATQDSPTLQFEITRAIVESIDKGGNPIGVGACPWLPPNPSPDDIENCKQNMSRAHSDIRLSADSIVDKGTFFDVGGSIDLFGQHSGWDKDIAGNGAERALWTIDNFDVNLDVDGDGKHARVNLLAPIKVNVPVQHLKKNDIFLVWVEAGTGAMNKIQGESFVGAFFRDPLETSGVGVSFTGLKLIPRRADVPTGFASLGCTTAPDPAAGALQFKGASFKAPEDSASAGVVVERVGGTKGRVSVVLETVGGTAVPGSDYQSLKTVVRFADGEGGTRRIGVPLVNDNIAEPDKTIALTLSQPGGCATLGAQASATMTILDDDRPPPPTFTIGGTVTGLTGSGLALRNQLGERVRPTANGTYSFAGRQANGSAYTVSVETQPTNPLQVCTVSNGSGTINGGDVTNIGVDCATPLPNGALDASFGSAGKVSNAFTPAKALALQADGKLLALGDLTLSRYNADGSLDAAFGSGGKVAIVANGGGLDTMQALALQADGKIVVAGNTSLPTVFNPDFVVLRYNADGSLDTGFGSGGKVVTDFNGMSDRANAVLVQPDGKIVAVGAATLGTLVRPDQDMALVRYLADGRLDSSFGSGGKVTRNVVGQGDSGDAAVLQADGKIVVAGFVALANGPTDFGIVRFASDGSPDTSFGTSGTTRVDFGGDDRPADLALQADGKIIVGGSTSSGGGRYALLRLNGDGSPDANFGTAGLVSSPFTGSGDFGRAVALQSDGRIVVAGAVGNSSSNSDFGIARYTSAGALDASFGSGGLVRVDFFGSSDGASDMLIQPDGKIVATGSARNGATTGLGLVRVLP